MSQEFKNFDFGFTLVDEDELAAVQSAQQDTDAVSQDFTKSEKQNIELRQKCDTMYQMIQPLLMNLAQDPEKEYILWPERAAKVSQFKEMVDKVYMK